MTVSEARDIVRKFDENKKVTPDDEFLFTEAMQFLIAEENRPEDMMYLGGYYYEIRHFNLALKYYEMAATYDFDDAYECLGYIWYYGRTGTKDYKKAFHYFSKMMEKGNLVATYKVADMYENGYYVDKDHDRYTRMIEELYPKVCKCNEVYDPVPEVFTRLAKIRTEQGKTDEAIDLYLAAKDFLAQRIIYNPFFGNLNIMKWLIDDLYELIKIDEEPDMFDLYDMYYLFRTPHEISFYYDDEMYHADAVEEGAECSIHFYDDHGNDKWFHSRDDFFKDAMIDDMKITALYYDLYGFEVMA